MLTDSIIVGRGKCNSVGYVTQYKYPLISHDRVCQKSRRGLASYSLIIYEVVVLFSDFLDGIGIWKKNEPNDRKINCC